MNKNIKKSFYKELQKIAEEPSWKDRIIGLLRASSYKSKPMIPFSHPELLARSIGTPLVGGVLGATAGTGIGIIKDILEKNRKANANRIVRLATIGSLIGTNIGAYKGLSDFYKKRGIRLNAMVNPKFSEEAIKQYI